MNGRKSPDPPTAQAGDSGEQGDTARDDTTTNETNGLKSSPFPAENGTVEGGDSEAETLIDSPVKKQQQQQQQQQAAKMERPPKHRIGSLPVPTGNDEEDDSANVSPAPSTVASVEKTTSTEDVKDINMDTMGDDPDDDSDSLSSPQSNPPSRGSSLSRAASERPGLSRNEQHSPNPRKRKHRASSVSLPNKRPSIDIPKRRLRGLHSEELGEDASLSSKLRSHRRAASTQSAFNDGVGDIPKKKRRSEGKSVAKEPKSARSTWEESDASSEATSHGNADARRSARGVGRSTSTPGRPAGREHKRHVNKYGFTRLAEACENNDLEMVKEWREKDPDQLELAEFAGNKPLQIAALNGNVEVVDYLIDQGCQIDCANVDKDTPLIDAAENGHLDVVNSLLNAGVDPLRQNRKGQQALDVVTDEVDDADDIRATLRKAIEKWNSTGAKQKREEAEVMHHRAGPSKELHFMARTYENLLRLVQINDRTGVREFLDARVPVDNAVVAAAAKTGDTYLVNMLLAEMTEKKAHQKAEKPLLGVLGSSHFEMVKSLTELDNFNPLFRNRQQQNWPEIAEERHGPNWRQEYELLNKLYIEATMNEKRRSSSPVTKRDSGKRRIAHRAPEEEEDSEEEEAPKRRNTRKLMSKREQREMRAAKGKPASGESSDDESGSEQVNGADASEEKTMKPPESPVISRRTPPTRSRTKSLSAQPPDTSPRTRRRSSSLRGQGDNTLPTVQETAEDKEAAEKQKEEENRLAEQAEEVRQAELKRVEEEKAEADAAAKRAADEEARRVEEERKAEEARVAEEARKAEEARIAEEERVRREQEMAAKRAHREAVIASLPDPMGYVLRPDSPFDYDTANLRDISYLIGHFTPLNVVKIEHSDPPTIVPATDDNRPLWISNLQAAPLLGKRGFELLLSDQVPGFKGSLADTFDTKDVNINLKEALISHVTVAQPQDLPTDPQIPLDENGHSTLTWPEELERMAYKQNAVTAGKQRLRDGEGILRYVRLDQVLQNLHPCLKPHEIEAGFMYYNPPRKQFKEGDGSTMVERIAANAKPKSRTYVNGEWINAPKEGESGGGSRLWTQQVTVTHQK